VRFRPRHHTLLAGQPSRWRVKGGARRKTLTRPPHDTGDRALPLHVSLHEDRRAADVQAIDARWLCSAVEGGLMRQVDRYINCILACVGRGLLLGLLALQATPAAEASFRIYVTPQTEFMPTWALTGRACW
jgi:hypothetical protein